MCMWTKIKRVWAIGSIVAVLLSVITLISTAMWWIGWQAIADYRIETLRTDRDKEEKESEEIKDCIADMKTDIAVVKTDVTWIKEYLQQK